jgi:fumarate reductase subunit C
MSGRARVDAMRPHQPGRTRTADPRPPDLFPTRGNYLGYLAFGAAAGLLMLVGFGILRAVWTLGEHDPAKWQAVLDSYKTPAMLLLHVFLLVAIVWFALRFFRVFPKTQPPKIGPFKRPSDVFFAVAFGFAFALATALASLVLGGALL